MIRPLTGRISPAFRLEPDKGGGSGGETQQPPAMGGAFSTLAKSLKESVPGEEETPEDPPDPTPKPAAAPTPKPAAPPEKKPATPEPKKGAASVVPADVFKPADPAAKKEETPPVTPPAEEIQREELTKGMSDGARKNFSRLDDHWKERYAKLEAELATAKQSAADPAQGEETKRLKAEHEKLKAEHAEMLKTVELIGVERSPQFQAKYVAGRNKLVDEAVKKVTKAGGSADKFRAALELDGRARYDAIEEALDGAPAFVTNQVAAAVSQIEALDEEKTEALQNAKGTLTEWGEQETSRQREEGEKLNAMREARFSELLPEMAKECIFLRRVPDGTEGAEKWNAIVEEVSNGGKEFLFKASNFDEFASAAVKARAYDHLQGLFISTREENLALQKQIAELMEAEPGSQNRGGGGGGGTTPADENLSFADRVKRDMDAGAAAA